MGGVTNSSGRLEVCANGKWGRVCNAFRYWGPDNARVVCHQLRFSEQGKDAHNSFSSVHGAFSLYKVHLLWQQGYLELAALLLW